MFNTLKKPINFIYLIQVAAVFLAAFGIIPRSVIIGLALLVSGFVLRADLETATAFFVRSIPIFAAIPFTSYFDSFNIWRIASGLIFLKWFLRNKKVLEIKQAWKKITVKISFRDYPFSFYFLVFFVLALWSLIPAPDFLVGVKRIIYFINLSLIAFVIYDLVKKRPDFAKELAKNILISGILVAIVAVFQLISVYLVSIYEFVDFWAGSVQLGFYGWQWSQIAQETNTWFAYFGQSLSLRVFSTFPDSHSFPFFILMAIPSLLAWSLTKVFQKNENQTFKKLVRIRSSLLIALLPIFYLLAILSGTRGIWLAVLGPVLLLPFLIKKAKTRENKNILKYLAVHLVIFVLLFSVAYPIMGSDQFQIRKSSSEILNKRVRSILDLEETSNRGRILIWKATVKSIIKNPLLGVGIGNYPVVLSQNTEYAKAGSSAHNLYLNVAAEIGLLGLCGFLGMLWLILLRGFRVFAESGDIFIKIYSAGFVLYIIWLLFYSLTDAVLFDERAFLIFAINSAIILALHKKSRFLAGVEISR